MPDSVLPEKAPIWGQLQQKTSGLAAAGIVGEVIQEANRQIAGNRLMTSYVGNGTVRFRHNILEGDGPMGSGEGYAEQRANGRWQKIDGVGVQWAAWNGEKGKSHYGDFRVNYTQLWAAYRGNVPDGLRTIRHGNGDTAFNFQFDRSGRVERAWTNRLQVGNGGRSDHLQAVAGGRYRIDGVDNGGHIFASQFKGPVVWYNHFAQNAEFNQNRRVGGEYYQMEQDWKADVRAGDKVGVSVNFRYTGSSLRPNNYTVTTTRNGRSSDPVLLQNPIFLKPRGT
jgi:DNA/RNA non-specific endonuclease